MPSTDSPSRGEAGKGPSSLILLKTMQRRSSMRKAGLQANSKFFGDTGPCFGLGYCLEMTEKYTMNIKESVLAMP